MIRCLVPFLCQDTSKIVFEYARELRGNYVASAQPFNFVVPLHNRMIAAQRLLVYDFTEQSLRLARCLYEACLSMIALRNGNIAIGNASSMVKVYDDRMQVTAEVDLSFPGYFRVNALAELSDGTLAIGVQHTLIIWDLVSGKRVSMTVCTVGTIITKILALPNSALLTGDNQGRLSLRVGRKFTTYPKAHSQEVTELVLLGKNIASSSLDMTVKIWTADMQCVHVMSMLSPVLAMCVLHDGRLVVGCDNQHITVWDDTFTCVLTLREKGESLQQKGNYLTFAVFKQQFIVSDWVDTIVYE